MNAELTYNSYGKSAVRISKVRRFPDRHELVEMKVNINLRGDFSRSYTLGNNATVVATDSMKNTVYLLAKDHPLDSPESFALHLADHFVKSYSQVSDALIEIDQSTWQRIVVNGRPHPTAFESNGPQLRTSQAHVNRIETLIHGGLSNLLVLKTTDSAFTGFVRDAFTTLPEATDRILATQVEARWEYINPNADFNSAYTGIRAAMLDTFANHKSDAVQQTLFDMGAAALAVEPAIVDIQLKMPNKHRIPFNFKPFGKEFNNDVYITTEEPSGEIVGHLRRGGRGQA